MTESQLREKAVQTLRDAQDAVDGMRKLLPLPVGFSADAMRGMQLAIAERAIHRALLAQHIADPDALASMAGAAEIAGASLVDAAKLYLVGSEPHRNILRWATHLLNLAVELQGETPPIAVEEPEHAQAVVVDQVAGVPVTVDREDS